MLKLLGIILLVYAFFWALSPEGQQWMATHQNTYTQGGIRAFVEPVWCGQCLENQQVTPLPPPQPRK